MRIVITASCLGALLISGCSKPEAPEESVASEMGTEVAPVLFMEDGGWCWFQDPRAIISNGKLIVGGISGQSGDIRVGVYDLESGSIDGVAVLHEKLERDDHDAPVFFERPDGRLLVMWAKHGPENVHYYAVSESDDYLDWSDVKTLTHPFEIPEGAGWIGVTYMNLYTAGDDEKLYNFFRLGRDLNPYFTASEDNGDSWEGLTHFIKDPLEGNHRPYVRYAQKDNATISVTFTDAHPRKYGNSLYYTEFDGSGFLRADGTSIQAIGDGALPASEAEKIYEGSETSDRPEGHESVPNSAWTVDVENDADGNPWIGYSVYMSGDDIRYRMANWNGEDWVDRQIAYAGTHLYPRESSYSGLLAIDPDDPENVVISSDVNPATGEAAGGEYEIYMGRIDDGVNGSTDWTPLTRDSTQMNIRPIIVTGEGYKVLLWMSGPYSTYQDYDSDIVGHVLQRPEDATRVSD